MKKIGENFPNLALYLFTLMTVFIVISNPALGANSPLMAPEKELSQQSGSTASSKFLFVKTEKFLTDPLPEEVKPAIFISFGVMRITFLLLILSSVWSTWSAAYNKKSRDLQ